MFYDTEWKNIIGDGEFSETVILLFNSVQYSVKATKGHGWSRKEVDGQLTVDKPLNTRSIVVSKEEIPSAISNTDYGEVQFIIDDVVFSTFSHTGTDVIRFYLTASGEDISDIEEEDSEAIDDATETETNEDGLMEV